VARGREPGHVQARLGDDRHGGLRADAGDLREPLHRGRCRRARARVRGRDAVRADSLGRRDRAYGGLDLVLDRRDGAVQQRDVA
jgi:hypothetical protein